MENKKNNNKIIYVIIAILLVVVIVIGVLILLKMNKTTNTANVNSNENNAETITLSNNNSDDVTTKVQTVSFKQMDSNDESLTDDQKAIAKFFDEDFFEPYSYEEIVRYADILKGINISSYCQVNSILSSDNENFEAVCKFGGSWDSSWEDITDLIIIKGQKPEKMVVSGDYIPLRGKLIGAETREINGKSKYLPIVEIIEIGEIDTTNWYSEDNIRQVAKAVFGNNIKVRRPTDDETSKMCNGEYIYTYQDFVWLVEMENQSNLNFKVFDIWQSLPNGAITYNGLYNEGVEQDYLNKQLFVTPDLQKYIVFNMSRKDKYVYIDIYDRDLNKLWSKEISKASQIVWDATDTNLFFVSDNDFYNINMETGETIFETYVGKKTDIRVIENGYLLLNADSDDTVMFVDNDGNIKNKFDVSFDEDLGEIGGMSIQKLDNNYVILYTLLNKNSYQWSSKYIIVDGEGNKIKESD